MRVYKLFYLKINMKNKNILIYEILEKIKQNKKYSSISDDIIKKLINYHLNSNPRITQSDKETIKELRAKLHKLYSSFQTKKKRKKENYLEELKQNPNSIERTKKLLSITLSTKERVNDYEQLYKNIFFITSKPKILLDVGAGLNPLSFPLMNLQKLIYYAYDINIEDKNFLNKYFQIMKSFGLNGKAEILDITNLKSIKKLPQSDLIFLFKIIDIIPTKKLAEQILLILIKKTNFIIVSFPTKTITRKQMNNPKRKWFELMLERNNLVYKIIEISNEIFYIINYPSY